MIRAFCSPTYPAVADRWNKRDFIFPPDSSNRVGVGCVPRRDRPRAGHRITKVGDEVDLEDLPGAASPRCARLAGFSLHANLCVPAHDRMRLERLCRYTGSSPIATERLSLLPDGKLLYWKYWTPYGI